MEQSRSLGKAFFENPTTANEAIAEFKKALDLNPNSDREKLNYALALLHGGKTDEAVRLLKAVQQHDPKLPHTWFNLGIYYRKNNDPDSAITQFQGMLRLTPNEAIPHYQLGALYRQKGQAQQAIVEFEQAAKLDPQLAAPHFQLYNLLRQAGRTDEAAEHLRIFQDLKKQQEGAAVPEDVDWCSFAEIYDPPRQSAPVRAMTPTYSETTLNSVDAATAGMIAIDSTGKGVVDLLVWSSHGVTLYSKGTQAVADSGLTGITGIVDIAAGDFDNDGLMDLCVVTTGSAAIYRNTGGKFEKFAAELPQRGFDRAVWVDYDHDYDLDLLLFGEKPALIRNQGGAGFADRTQDFPFAAGRATSLQKIRTVPDSKAFDIAAFYEGHAPVLYKDELGGHYTPAAWNGQAKDRMTLETDFDGDGRQDRVRIEADGTVKFAHNTTRATNRWIRIQLAGVKSLKLAQDAEIEIKTGTLYRKQMYDGYPITFDTGSYEQVDVVRITWMNGLIQNETKQTTNTTHRIEEAQRLSGSCPMIWTWNGKEFQFITDVLGVAPLGASDGDGSYFPVDHDEFVSIPASALIAENGSYQVRVTEELSEVSYLDQVRLFAVDHPKGTEIYTNEKFKAPPYPEDKLFGVKRRIYPTGARDGRGRDVLAALLKTDGRYPDQFTRSENGVAERHTLELDFGNAAPAGKATLLLHGWVDWPDGSTFRAASQESKEGLMTPSLEMQDANGKWVTVNADMGMPAGKPKTIAVDVTFPSASRKLRIVTNLCVYWDEIFLSEETGAPTVTQTESKLLTADLHFRGFSEAKIDAERTQPDTYTYSPVSPGSFWNPTPGLYTRYGDVRKLAEGIDDELIIMGSGDELTLHFDARDLPPLPAGWQRDFLLKVDGWAKDRDPNTAFSTTVEPLPFHGMSVYPYPKNEHFPDDPAHQQWRRDYNTRPALRLTRPLSE
jgi:Flp pilus assembly protein TadD